MVFCFLISTNSLNKGFSKCLEINRHYYIDSNTHTHTHLCTYVHTHTYGINMTMSRALVVTSSKFIVSL